MPEKKLYIRFNIGDTATITDGCNRGNVGKVERIIYDEEGLKYDIRSFYNRLYSEVPEEDLK